MIQKAIRLAVCAMAALTASAGAALAVQPLPWQMGFQPAATPVMQDIFRLRNGKLGLVRQLSEPWFPQP